jgi:hypothetical protein
MSYDMKVGSKPKHSLHAWTDSKTTSCSDVASFVAYINLSFPPTIWTSSAKRKLDGKCIFWINFMPSQFQIASTIHQHSWSSWIEQAWKNPMYCQVLNHLVLDSELCLKNNRFCLESCILNWNALIYQFYFCCHSWSVMMGLGTLPGGW